MTRALGVTLLLLLTVIACDSAPHMGDAARSMDSGMSVDSGDSATGSADSAVDSAVLDDPTLAIFVEARSVLFVGAHPDDETTVAPLLSALCASEARRCTLAVATRGENGGCALPAGCVPTLADVRAQELEASAEQLQAETVQWDRGDTSLRGPARCWRRGPPLWWTTS